MYNRLIIIGAGGHGKVIADIAVKVGYTDIFFIDDKLTGKCLNFDIVGKSEIIDRLNDGKTDFVIAIGNNLIREKISKEHNLNYVSLIHPSAQIGLDVDIGGGTVVMACAVINSSAKIGIHCIINSSSVIEHDNKIDDYVHISPNAALGGTVHIGKYTNIGIGATVKNNIDICSGCVIGAGAVVVNNIVEPRTCVGVPAKSLRQHRTKNIVQNESRCGII